VLRKKCQLRDVLPDGARDSPSFARFADLAGFLSRASTLEPVLCATGDFKAEVAFLNVLGALLHVEQFREIVRLPRLRGRPELRPLVMDDAGGHTYLNAAGDLLIAVRFGSCPLVVATLAADQSQTELAAAYIRDRFR
jgi:hypothetical protein